MNEDNFKKKYSISEKQSQNVVESSKKTGKMEKVKKNVKNEEKSQLKSNTTQNAVSVAAKKSMRGRPKKDANVSGDIQELATHDPSQNVVAQLQEEKPSIPKNPLLDASVASLEKRDTLTSKKNTSTTIKRDTSSSFMPLENDENIFTTNLETMAKPKRGRPKRTQNLENPILLLQYNKEIEEDKTHEPIIGQVKEVSSKILTSPRGKKTSHVAQNFNKTNQVTSSSLSHKKSNDLQSPPVQVSSLQMTDLSVEITPDSIIQEVSTPIREVTSQRRRPGRPAKKAAKQSLHLNSVEPKNIISLDENKKLDNQFNKTKASRNLTSFQNTSGSASKEQPLAIQSSERLSIEGKQSLAIEAQTFLSLESQSMFALESNERIALSSDSTTASLQTAVTQKKRGRKPKGQKHASSVLSEHSENIEQVSQKEKTNQIFDKQTNDTERSKGRNHRKARSSQKASSKKISADFIAGEFGTTHNENHIYEQNAYTEHAALGVMGIIDEAPIVEALLPLVQDSESTQENTTSKKSRRSRRSRKSESKAIREEKNNKSEQELQEITEFYLDADSAPIAEGDLFSLLEAEESIKKAGKSAKKQVAKEQVNRMLFVSSVPDEQVEVVITENGVVSEYFIEMEHQAKIRGNIYKGVINNLDTNLQAAFVNFGGGKNGFLQIDEVHPEYWMTPHTEGGSKYPPIQKVLKVGQEVMVQVVKEPAGSKGAFLTTWISLAGRFIVLTPGQEQIGVSRKVEDNAERTRLRELLTGINPGDNMGVIVRTASEGASKSNIQSDLKFLKRVWKDVQKKVQTTTAPSLIHQEADLASRAVRDYLTSDITEVWVDSEEVRDALKDLVSVVFPRNKNILKLHKDTRSTLWERFNILRQLDEVTKREVVLPSGGRLVFDQTEALMAIDINSGKTHGKINFEAMVYRTNMEAVEAIARHLRLRDIGGQVVIDFIEMRDRGHCRDVEKGMRNAMKRDRARHDVGRLSSFGLLELVRQRTGTSAISISSEPCPHCRGTGFRRNLEWQSQGVLREIKSKLATGKNIPNTYVHHVEQEVAFYILNKKRDRLSELEEKFSIKIEIHVK